MNPRSPVRAPAGERRTVMPMGRQLVIRLTGLVIFIASGAMLAVYLWVMLDTPSILQQSGSDPKWGTYVNGSVLIVLHFVGVVSGIGLLRIRSWGRVFTISYLVGLLAHGLFWFLQRPRFDGTSLELSLLLLVALFASWLLFRSESSMLFETGITSRST